MLHAAEGSERKENSGEHPKREAQRHLQFDAGGIQTELGDPRRQRQIAGDSQRFCVDLCRRRASHGIPEEDWRACRTSRHDGRGQQRSQAIHASSCVEQKVEQASACWFSFRTRIQNQQLLRSPVPTIICQFAGIVSLCHLWADVLAEGRWSFRLRGPGRESWAWNPTMAKCVHMGILAGRGMLDRSSGRLGVLHDPQAILLFQGVGNLHPGALRRSGLGLELHLRLGLVPLNGNIGDVHVHGAEIDRFQGSEVLVDAGADGIGIAFLFLAAGEEDKKPDDGQKVGSSASCESPLPYL